MVELYGYQHQAVDWLYTRDAAALFLDMGLGKTASVLSALEPWNLPALVIAPPRVATDVWPQEGAKWRPDLTVRAAVGKGAAERLKVLTDQDVDVVSLSFNSIKEAVPVASRFNTVVYDELSKLKGRGTWWKAARKISQAVPTRWGLTGTPTPQGYQDLWAQLAVLDHGERLGKHFTHFQREFWAPVAFANNRVIKWRELPGAHETIQARIADICLGMGTEGRVELPPVHYVDHWLDLPPKARRFYQTMKAESVAAFHNATHSAANAQVLTGKSAQIAAGAIYDDRGSGYGLTELHDAKWRMLDEIVEGTDSGILAVYGFKWQRAELLRRYPGAEPIDAPDVIDRWNRGEVPMLVIHPLSAGHGLNLQHGGHTVVWLSPTWSPDEYQQVVARLLRNGQLNPVIVHHILMRETVEASMMDVMRGKASVQQMLKNYLEA